MHKPWCLKGSEGHRAQVTKETTNNYKETQTDYKDMQNDHKETIWFERFKTTTKRQQTATKMKPTDYKEMQNNHRDTKWLQKRNKVTVKLSNCCCDYFVSISSVGVLRSHRMGGPLYACARGPVVPFCPCDWVFKACLHLICKNYKHRKYKGCTWKTWTSINMYNFS